MELRTILIIVAILIIIGLAFLGLMAALNSRDRDEGDE